MNEFGSKFTDKEKKYLLWSVFDYDSEDDDKTFKIQEFRVCDWYLDWCLCFHNKNRNTVFSEEFTTAFFDEIPSGLNDYDVFCIFGQISIVCCERALYHFFLEDDIQHEKLYDECLGYDIDCRCSYLLEKKFLFPSLCSNCQFNFIMNVSDTFIKLK